MVPGIWIEDAESAVGDKQSLENTPFYRHFGGWMGRRDTFLRRYYDPFTDAIPGNDYAMEYLRPMLYALTCTDSRLDFTTT